MANGAGAGKIRTFGLLLLLSGGMPSDMVTHAPLEDLIAEARAHKHDQDALDVDEDLDGRSAYVNNQFVPNDPVEMIDDEQNAPLYEILQKQMEQVLAATGPDVPIYEDDKSKRPRDQQLPHKPLFTNNNNEAETDEDYVDEAAPEPEQGYVDAEKPDAATVEGQMPDAGYQVPQLSTVSVKPIDATTTTKPPSRSSASPTRNRPQRRRTTSTIPRTTRPISSQATTPSSINHTGLTTSTTSPVSFSSSKQRPSTSTSNSNNSKSHISSNPSNSLPHDPQIYQHKRRIIFKTISTGSQFVNSPIGDLMIKFSIGFAKPAQGGATPSNEALRAFSNNLLRNIELQKLKRNKVQKD
ncbi:hypothetical protein ACLKA7_015192 [Drosophila subpalustris]